MSRSESIFTIALVLMRSSKPGPNCIRLSHIRLLLHFALVYALLLHFALVYALQILCFYTNLYSVSTLMCTTFMDSRYYYDGL